MNQFFLKFYLCIKSSFFLYGYIKILSIFHPYIKPISLIKAKDITNICSIGAKKVAISGTGCLMVFTKEYLYKFPLGNTTAKALKIEYDNYKKIKKTSLSNFVDYYLGQELLSEEIFYKMSILKTLSYSDTSIAKNIIIKSLSENGNFGKASIFSKENHLLGYEVILKYCNNAQRLELSDIKGWLNGIEYCTSYIHGDLTPLNIMKNNGVVFIDLDRFDFAGFNFFDKIHYHIEYEAKMKGLNSYDFIALNFELLLSEYSKQELLSYLFFRTGAEKRSDVSLHPSYYLKIITLILLIKRHVGKNEVL
ncbi:hypothetical protein [Pseudoalteromonas undina]|uniref:hypothetical protein n=1 Tax=Pseudoalteromonas undina TaxID=43660 RepID=UPI001865D2B0|nr:hypothetical protein [Pseudoalteromonas undina]